MQQDLAAAPQTAALLEFVDCLDHLLRQRKLVAPFRNRYMTTRAYYIVRADHAAARPEAQAFVDWLQEEARKEAAEAEFAPEPGSRPRRTRKAR